MLERIECENREEWLIQWEVIIWESFKTLQGKDLEGLPLLNQSHAPKHQKTEGIGCVVVIAAMRESTNLRKSIGVQL